MESHEGALLDADPCGSMDHRARKLALRMGLYNVHSLSEILETKIITNLILFMEYGIYFRNIMSCDSIKTQV